MTEHPYAGPDTIVPGEVAYNDPSAELPYCPDCDDEVETVQGQCVRCGTDLS